MYGGGIGLGINLWRAALGGLSSSAAALMLGNDTNGLALDFTDSSFSGLTGFYGSARIKDTTTSANNYNSSPDKAESSLLTYTSPSPKMVMGPSGTLRYQAHNLFLNSAAPANQSVTVVSGATYAVDITGSVTTTLSGATTGTITAGTTTFTAGSTTLTFGSTSGTGTVAVRRTPSDNTYLATTGSVRYSLPYEWSSAGVLQGIRVEEQRTNICLQSQNFGDATWIKSGAVTVTGNYAAGPDGTTTAARMVSTGANSVYQTITVSASTQYTLSFYAKNNGGSRAAYRVYDNTGSADIVGITSYFSLINSSTYTRITVTFTTPVGCTSVLVYLNSDGSGGADVIVAQAQLEAGSFATSPIQTISASVTRLADNISLATSAFPDMNTAGTLFAEFMFPVIGLNRRLIQLNKAQASDVTDLYVPSSGNKVSGFADDTDGTTASPTVTANTTWKAVIGFTSGAQSRAGTGSAVATASAAMTTAYTVLNIGCTVGSSQYTNGYIRKMYAVPRKKTDSELQADVA